MKFAHLVMRNLFRNKRRTLLTMLSVAVALFLFATLRSVNTTLRAAAQVGSESRLIIASAMSIVFPLPRSYLGRIQAAPNVKATTWANWFGGIYQDRKNFFPQFAIDAETYLPMYPEIILPPDQKQAFLAERTAAIVGERLIKRFGWKLGQTVTLSGTIFPGDWSFTIRGIYRAGSPAVDESTMLFHYAYLDERSGRQAEPGWFVIRLDDPSRAADVASTIDAQFKNSSAPTKTGTERAFQAGFISMFGNVGFLVRAIGSAVLFAILLVAANSMMMSARERIGEVAVLKTVGFTDGLLFGLVLAEAGIITIVGGLLGIFGAKVLFAASHFNAGGFLQGFTVAWSTVGFGVAIALLLGLVSGAVPALQAARLSVVQALRRVA